VDGVTRLADLEVGDRIRTGIGIPYGRIVSYDDGTEKGLTWFALCPSCDSLVLLTEMKDDESFSKREYAAHWNEKHLCANCGRPHSDPAGCE
jgi:hypothetical protein